MRVARPWALELDYTRDMMVPLLLRPGAGWPRSVLSIGLGAASLIKFLYKHRPRAVQTILEIEPAVISAARQSFRLPPESAHLRIEIADGSDYVASSQREFDLILVDGYDAKGRSGMLDTLPFYCNCQARLTERGIMAANLLTRNHGIRGSFDRVRAAFEGRAPHSAMSGAEMWSSWPVQGSRCPSQASSSRGARATCAPRPVSICCRRSAACGNRFLPAACWSCSA